MKIKSDVDGDGTYEYTFLADYTDKISVDTGQDLTKMPMPTKPADQGLLMNIFGEEKEFEIELTLINDGEDKANGTAPQDGTFSDTTGDGTEDVVTLKEQYRFLERYIKKVSLDRMNKIEGGDIDLDQTEGIISNIEIKNISDEPMEMQATIQMVVGKGLNTT